MSSDEQGLVLDRDSHITPYSQVCSFCRHMVDGKERTCSAYPDKIPVAIWAGLNDHTQPFPDDHGVQFKLIPSEH
jgi:hypothetical protein